MHAARSRSTLTRAAACISLLATAAAVHAQPLELYVDDDAPAGGDGLSWQTAFRDLQDALNAPLPAPVSSRLVKVAAGFYRPGAGSTSRHSTFTLLSGTTVVGGFAGISGSDPDERNPQVFVSVCSGDLLGDDAPGFSNRSDNAYAVLTTGGDLIALDGLTIRGAYAEVGDPTIGIGGGVSVQLASGWLPLTMQGCLIEDNFAPAGGGVGSVGGFVRMDACKVRGNRAGNSGGGIAIASGLLSRSVFTANSAVTRGGAALVSNRWVAFAQCAFNGNSASDGGAVFLDNADMNMGNCTVGPNFAASGPGIKIVGARYMIVMSSVVATGVGLPAIASALPGRVALEACILEGGIDPAMLAPNISFIGMGNLDVSPRFVDPVGTDGVIGTQDDDLRVRSSSLAIDAARFVDQILTGLSEGSDLAGFPRVHDDPGMPNIGNSAGGAVDLGAFEFQGVSCRADHDGDTFVNVPDIFAFLSDWFAQSPEADMDRDTRFEVSDLFAFLAAWFAGCP